MQPPTSHDETTSSTPTVAPQSPRGRTTRALPLLLCALLGSIIGGVAGGYAGATQLGHDGQTGHRERPGQHEKFERGGPDAGNPGWHGRHWGVPGQGPEESQVPGNSKGPRGSSTERGEKPQLTRPTDQPTDQPAEPQSDQPSGQRFGGQPTPDAPATPRG